MIAGGYHFIPDPLQTNIAFGIEGGWIAPILVLAIIASSSQLGNKFLDDSSKAETTDTGDSAEEESEDKGKEEECEDELNHCYQIIEVNESWKIILVLLLL